MRKIGEMKRLIPIFAAAIALAGPLAMAGQAAAKDHPGHGRGGDRASDHRDRGDRGGGHERRGGDERGGYRDRGGPPPAWRDGRGDAGRGAERGGRRAYDADGPGRQAPGPRRGGYLPPQAGGAIPDYGRYRLRPPPRGFAWVRTDNGYAMVSQETGRVFDVVPY